MFSYQHHGWTSANVNSDVELNMVSDKEYFSQLGDNLSTSSLTSLLQQAGFSYSGRNWSGSAIIQSYQTIDESVPDSARPYRRLPQWTLMQQHSPAPQSD